jgi:hypothetical protein
MTSPFVFRAPGILACAAFNFSVAQALLPVLPAIPNLHQTLERETGIEPANFLFKGSAPLRPHALLAHFGARSAFHPFSIHQSATTSNPGAGDGNRTRDQQLGRL